MTSSTTLAYSQLFRSLLVAVHEFRVAQPNETTVFNWIVQTLSNGLYYLSTMGFHSGLCTQTAWDTGRSASSLTKEHPYGRKASTEYLLNLALEGVSAEEFDREFQNRVTFHLTTKDENEKLKQWFKANPNGTPQEAYAAVCSPLVKWVTPSQR